jgi:hypothetical protein
VWESAAAAWVGAIVEFEGAVLGFRGASVAFEVIVAFDQGNATFKSVIVARRRTCLYFCNGRELELSF